MDTHGIIAGAALSLCHSFMKEQVAAGLSARMALGFSSSRKVQKEETLTTYSEVVNYLGEKYATDYVITETDAKIMRFTEPLD